MTAPFDPYHKWLGIPAAHQPPTHYRLLGVEPFEADPDVIEAAVNQRVAYLQDLAVGDRVKESQKLLNEVAAARRVLLNAEKKASYDAGLRSAQAAPQPAAAPVYVPTSTPEMPTYQPPAPAVVAESDLAFPALSFEPSAPAARTAKKPPASAKVKPPASTAAPADPTAGPAPLKPWVLVAGGFGCLAFGFVVMSAILLLGGKPAAKPPANKRAAAVWIDRLQSSRHAPRAVLRPEDEERHAERAYYSEGGIEVSPSSPPGWLPCLTAPT